MMLNKGEIKTCKQELNNYIEFMESRDIRDFGGTEYWKRIIKKN